MKVHTEVQAGQHLFISLDAMQQLVAKQKSRTDDQINKATQLEHLDPYRYQLGHILMTCHTPGSTEYNIGAALKKEVHQKLGLE